MGKMRKKEEVLFSSGAIALDTSYMPFRHKKALYDVILEVKGPYWARVLIGDLPTIPDLGHDPKKTCVRCDIPLASSDLDQDILGVRETEDSYFMCKACIRDLFWLNDK